jgi:hypothetical protein
VAGNGQFSSATLAVNNNAVYVGWDNWGFNSVFPYNTGGRLLVASSPLGAQLNFSAPQEIARTSIGFAQRIPAMPELGAGPGLSLASDPTRDNSLYAVFADRGNGLDIFLARSTDAGQTWQPAVTVNNDATLADQFSPGLAVDSYGNPNISFYDTRLSATFEAADLFLAKPSSTGNSFDNQRVSTASSNDSRSNPSRDYTANLGDRSAIAMASNTEVMTWTDTRLGDEDIFLSVVAQKPVIFTTGITWNNPGTVVYGTPLGSAQLGATASAPGTLTYIPSFGTVLNAGNQTLTVTFTPDNPAMFTSASTSVQISVQATPLTVKADSVARQYGSSNPQLTGSVTGLVGGDNISAIYSASADINSRAGYYDITPALVDPGHKLFNYTVNLVNGVLSVNPALISVTAGSASRPYGSANPLLSGTITGVLNPDNITAAFTTTAGASSVVGNYPISAILSDPGQRLSNYTVNLADGVLSVTPAPLTVTASAGLRIYGSSTPPLTGTIAGILNSDNITAAFATTAGPSSAVGKYSITPTLSDPGQRLPNYAITLVNSVLSVAPAPLRVLANYAARPYASPNPPLTGSIAGLVNSDSITAAYASDASIASPPGNYSIVPVINDPDNRLSNYAVTVTNGTLTVIPEPLITIVTSAGPSLALSFGAQNFHSSSKPLNVTVGNAGNTVLLVDSIALGGANAGDFAMTTDCGKTIAAGRTCTIGVTFTPTDFHNRSARIVLTDNTGGYPGTQQTVDLSGIGVLTYAVYATGSSCQAVSLSGEARIEGNVATNGNVQLSGEARVIGLTYAANTGIGSCRNGIPGMTIPGQMNNSISHLKVTLVNFTTLTPVLPGSADVKVNEEGAQLGPGAYHDIVVNGESTLTLLPGIYNINSIKLTGESRIKIASGGRVTLYVAASKNPLDLSGGSISNTSNDPTNFLIVYNGTGEIDLSGESDSYAIVYAPNAAVKLKGEASWHGALVVNTLGDSGEGKIYYEPNLGQ